MVIPPVKKEMSARLNDVTSVISTVEPLIYDPPS